MSYQIKDHSYILKNISNDESGNNFELKLNTKLGDVFDFLPYGRINKKETGIGATTLELYSKRNSIIVLPTRSIAKSKLNKDICYFSSVNSGKLETVSKKDKLIEYISSPVEFKKILVVADSLPSLIELIGISVYKDYFLLFDEIDSIQKDSTFRYKMESCIEYYKKFEFDKRALVSATLLDFSDPILKSERLTKFRYEKSNKGLVSLVKTSTLINTLKEKIQALHISKAGKIVIAINEIAACIEIADYLVQANEDIDYKDISILCGKESKHKSKIEKYSGQDIEYSVYPTKINFLTSAYFYGYDIKEDYNLILASDGNSDYKCLSEHECLQIKGRCREPNKLLSFTLVYTLNDKKLKFRTPEELIQFSIGEINALNCISSFYDNDEIGIDKAESTRDLLVKNSGFGKYNIVCKDGLNNYTTSFLNIDAYIENQRVRSKVYSNTSYLNRFFSNEGYTVALEDFESALVTESKVLDEDAKQDHQKLLGFLFSKKKPSISEIDLFIKSATAVNVVLCKFYKVAINVITYKCLKDKITVADTLLKARKLANMYNIWILPDNDFIKRNIQAVFKKNSCMNSESRLQLATELVKEMKIAHVKNLSDKKLINYISNFVAFQKTTKKVDGKAIKHYNVISYNPGNFRKIRSEKT